MDWAELSEIQREAAALLARGERGARPACGRAYYAAYSLLSHVLERFRIDYAHGWNNPAHADLPKYVSQIATLGPMKKQTIRRALRRLRQRREDADYRPRVTVDKSAARESLRDMVEIFQILERPA